MGKEVRIYVLKDIHESLPYTAPTCLFTCTHVLTYVPMHIFRYVHVNMVMTYTYARVTIVEENNMLQRNSYTGIRPVL